MGTQIVKKFGRLRSELRTKKIRGELRACVIAAPAPRARV